MGIKSTYNITRDTALRVLQSKIYQATDQALANMLQEFEESHFRNYIIVEAIDAEEWHLNIESVEEFLNEAH